MRWRFIHIPKTGGVSLAEAYTRGTEQGHAHLPAYVFPAGVRLFAMIREPTDRAVSMCAYLLRVKNRVLVPEDFHEWVAGGCQADYMLPHDDTVVVSWRGPDGLRMTSKQVQWLDSRVELLLYERFEQEAAKLAAAIGVAPKKPPRRNASLRRRNPNEYLTIETARRLEEIYWQDYELWRKVELGEAARWI